MGLSFEVKTVVDTAMQKWLRVADFDSIKAVCLQGKVSNAIVDDVLQQLSKEHKRAYDLAEKTLYAESVQKQVKQDEEDAFNDARAEEEERVLQLSTMGKLKGTRCAISVNQTDTLELERKITSIVNAIEEKKVFLQPLNRLLQDNQHKKIELAGLQQAYREKRREYDDKCSIARRREAELLPLRLKLTALLKAHDELIIEKSRFHSTHQHGHAMVAPVSPHQHGHATQSNVSVNPALLSNSTSHSHNHGHDPISSHADPFQEITRRAELNIQEQDSLRRQIREIEDLPLTYIQPARVAMEEIKRNLDSLEKKIALEASAVRASELTSRELEREIKEMNFKKEGLKFEMERLRTDGRSLDSEKQKLESKLRMLELQANKREVRQNERNSRKSARFDDQRNKLSSELFAQFSRDFAVVCKTLSNEKSALNDQVLKVTTFANWLQHLNAMLNTGALNDRNPLAIQHMIQLTGERANAELYLKGLADKMEEELHDFDTKLTQIENELEKELKSQLSINSDVFSDSVAQFKKHVENIEPLRAAYRNLQVELENTKKLITALKTKKQLFNLRVGVAVSSIALIAGIAVVGTAMLIPAAVTASLFISAVASSLTGLIGLIKTVNALNRISFADKIEANTVTSKTSKSIKTLEAERDALNVKIAEMKPDVDVVEGDLNKIQREAEASVNAFANKRAAFFTEKKRPLSLVEHQVKAVQLSQFYGQNEVNAKGAIRQVESQITYTR